MKNRIALSLLLCSFAATQATGDEGFSFAFIELQSQGSSIEFDDYTLHADGYGLLYSTDITRGFSLVGGYRHLDFDGPDLLDTGHTQERYDIGLSYRRPLLPGIEAYGSLRWTALDSTFSSSSANDLGVTGDAGLRFWVAGDFEFDTSLRFSDIDDPIAQTTRSLSIAGAARWHLTDRFSLAFGREYGEYESLWTGSFRYALGDWR